MNRYYINDSKVSKTKFYSELKKDYWYDDVGYENLKELKEFFETFDGNFSINTEVVNSYYYSVEII